jgi:hypothetical protein
MKTVESQAWLVRNLTHMNDSNSLEATLETFLIACKVDELSPRTLDDYRQKISKFIAFTTSILALCSLCRKSIVLLLEIGPDFPDFNVY